MIKINEFRDYRDFLSAKFEERQKISSHFTYQSCAQKLKTTKSYLKLVTLKKRHISGDKISALVKLFALTAFERDYLTFNLLVHTTKDESLRKFFEANMNTAYVTMSLRQNRELVETPPETEQVYQSWLAMTIHGLARVKGFEANSKWILQKLNDPKIPEDKVKKTLKELIAHQLIYKKDGAYTSDPTFRKSQANDSGSIEIYKVGYQKLMDTCERPQEFRPFSFYMMAIAISKAQGDQLMDKFLDLRNELIEMNRTCSHPEEVYFISNNFFNATPPKR